MQYMGICHLPSIKTVVLNSLQEVWESLVKQAKQDADYSFDEERFFKSCNFYEVKDITEKMSFTPSTIELMKVTRSK